ncbi:hypothetical protein EJ06DRAFT_552548 [Trichodelitschia bisporula]|uniref:Uncharacterized protein n=1 Tax=Trichodelitschia bisporula TaxID=703511 RepID=A0A6G1IAL4_9PEZI|nr:hypothetical protein EJ06DRAFT_552548 [Trichodelitschia bisporula]
MPRRPQTRDYKVASTAQLIGQSFDPALPTVAPRVTNNAPSRASSMRSAATPTPGPSSRGPTPTRAASTRRPSLSSSRDTTPFHPSSAPTRGSSPRVRWAPDPPRHATPAPLPERAISPPRLPMPTHKVDLLSLAFASRAQTHLSLSPSTFTPQPPSTSHPLTLHSPIRAYIAPLRAVALADPKLPGQPLKYASGNFRLPDAGLRLGSCAFLNLPPKDEGRELRVEVDRDGHPRFVFTVWRECRDGPETGRAVRFVLAGQTDVSDAIRQLAVQEHWIDVMSPEKGRKWRSEYAGSVDWPGVGADGDSPASESGDGPSPQAVRFVLFLRELERLHERAFVLAPAPEGGFETVLFTRGMTGLEPWLGTLVDSWVEGLKDPSEKIKGRLKSGERVYAVRVGEGKSWWVSFLVERGAGEIWNGDGEWPSAI